MKLTREIDGLCEIVYDVAQNLYCHLDGMEDGERDRLMDALDGSRGLFWQHAYLWAQEYHADWEALTPAQRDERSENYLAHIDAFAKAKFLALVAKYLPADVASVQVVPVVPVIDHHDERIMVPQFAGPSGETTGWGVYLRDHSGVTHWQADCIDEPTAMLLGRSLAAEHGVGVEEQAWKTNPSEKSE